MGAHQSKRIFDDLADSNSVRLRHDEKLLRERGAKPGFVPRKEFTNSLTPLDVVMKNGKSLSKTRPDIIYCEK